MNAKTAQTRTIRRAKVTASLASITFFLLKKYFSYLRILHTVFWLNLTPLNPSSFPTQLLKNEQKQQKSKFKLYWPYKLDCGRPTRDHTLKANWVCFLEAISSQHLISYGCDFEHIFPLHAENLSTLCLRRSVDIAWVHMNNVLVLSRQCRLTVAIPSSALTLLPPALSQWPLGLGGRSGKQKSTWGSAVASCSPHRGHLWVSLVINTCCKMCLWWVMIGARVCGNNDKFLVVSFIHLPE